MQLDTFVDIQVAQSIMLRPMGEILRGHKRCYVNLGLTVRA